MSQYRANRGLNYTTAAGDVKRVEAGDTFDDMNDSSLKDEISAGHVSEVSVDDVQGEVVVNGANVSVYTTDPDSVSKPRNTVVENIETKNPIDVVSSNPVDQTSGEADPGTATVTVNPVDAPDAVKGPSEPDTATETAPVVESDAPAPDKPSTATSGTVKGTPPTSTTTVGAEATDSVTPQKGASA